MCELCGMSFSEQVKPSFTFKSFRNRGRQNPDGWGVAGYKDGLFVFKQPISAEDSKLYNSLIDSDGLESKIFIAHVRKASRGGNEYHNTHPFDHSNYCFAHNGTIRNHEMLSTGGFKPIGETDSERVFYNLLSNVPLSDFDGLYHYLREINEQGSINCLLSDGENLFCYSDVNDHNEGLKFVKREPPYGVVRLSDEDFEIDLGLEKSDSQVGYVIASRPLTDEQWIPFNNGELKVFNNGRIIYSSHNFSELDKYVLWGVRHHPHRISIEDLTVKINNEFGKNFALNKVAYVVDKLLSREFLVLDSRSIDEGINTYYTNPDKRSEIRRMIRD